jgi:hypothetical protein
MLLFPKFQVPENQSGYQLQLSLGFTQSLRQLYPRCGDDVTVGWGGRGQLCTRVPTAVDAVLPTSVNLDVTFLW